jgi:hypothetical protein
MSAGRTGRTDLWGDRALPARGETQRLRVGPLTLWLRGAGDEVWITFVRSIGAADPAGEPPEDATWSRWALPEGPCHLHIAPAFPDRPLVVKSEHPFMLMRRASVRIYGRVPAWVRVEVVTDSGGQRVLLTEIPTVALSETWWGDFKDGELSYWLVTPGLRELTPELFDEHTVLSAVQLDNLSGDDLRVEKLSLRVEHLSIFEKEGWLWAEEVRVEYLGEDEGTEIHMDDLPPREAAGAREISPARYRSRSLRARTFARLKALSGWGD